MEGRGRVTRKSAAILLAAFVLTRIFLLWDSGRDRHIGAAFGDMTLYSGWAQQVVEYNQAPYAQVAIEYPPGVLPFIAAPQMLDAPGDEYRDRFVWLMLLIDVVGFAGLMLLARRAGSWLGPGLWIAATVLLGPIVYLRLDLVPAVATIWALERAAAGARRTSGGLWGFAVLAKLYPLLLLPAVLLASSRRKQIGGAALVAGGLVLVGFAGSLDHLWRSVVGYHGARGVQLESTWAALLLTAARRGYQTTVEFGYGALQVASSASMALKTVATAVSLSVLATGTWIIGRSARDDVGRIAVGLYGLLAVLLGVGTVLSPQFVVWLIALGAVGLCLGPADLRLPLFAVIAIAGLTQWIFPYWYDELIGQVPRAVVLLAGRNLLLIGIGTTILVNLGRSATADPDAAVTS